MPAAAVIPAPVAYIKAVAVKKLVVGYQCVSGPVCLALSLCGSAGLPNIGWPHSIVPDPSTGRSSEGPVGDRRRYLEQIRVLKAGSVCLYTYSWNWRIRPWLDLVGFESRREMINRD